MASIISIGIPKKDFNPLITFLFFESSRINLFPSIIWVLSSPTLSSNLPYSPPIPLLIEFFTRAKSSALGTTLPLNCILDLLKFKLTFFIKKACIEN